MTEIEIIRLITIIEIKFTNGEYRSFKFNSNRRYNKKNFFDVYTVGLFVRTDFIYDYVIEDSELNHTFNSIIVLTNNGKGKTFKTFSAFITYVKAMKEVEQVLWDI